MHHFENSQHFCKLEIIAIFNINCILKILLFIFKLCMKKLILRRLKTRRNTSLLVCPQIEGFVVLFIPRLLSRWRVKWPRSQQPGKKLWLLELVIKSGVYFKGNFNIDCLCLKGQAWINGSFFDNLAMCPLFCYLFYTHREVFVLVSFFPGNIRIYRFPLFSACLLNFFQTIDGMQWEYPKLLTLKTSEDSEELSQPGNVRNGRVLIRVGRREIKA